MEDTLIVDLYLQRNENAISETKYKYGEKLKRISLNIVRDTLSSEECENDTYLTAWNNIPPKEPKTYLFPFLAKITRNISINLYNKQHTKKRFAHILEITKEMEECIPCQINQHTTIDNYILIECINSFLKNLPKEQRIIFVLRYWYSYSVLEIAKKYNMSDSKVKSILFRTRKKLKKHFENEGIKI